AHDLYPSLAHQLRVKRLKKGFYGFSFLEGLMPVLKTGLQPPCAGLKRVWTRVWHGKIGL
ncbi:MAG: hypothetical protein QXP20_05720, partial [Candidatus Bathyarchaeia archaeon]